MKRLIKAALLLLLSNICLAALPCSQYQYPLWITPQTNDQAFIHAIQHAKKSIQITTYIFTHTPILRALINAKHRGVTIQVMLDKAPYQIKNVNIKMERQLKRAHIAFKAQSPRFSYLHQKTLLIDKHIAYLMTGNLSANGFKQQRNFILKITQTQLVKQIAYVFNSDWHHRKPKLHKTALIWSPENRGHWLFQLLHNSQHSLDIYAPYFSSKRFLETLEHLAQRGVKITVITKANPNSMYRQQISTLRQHGIHVILMKKPTLHAKMIIADHRIAYLGSNNFTTASFYDNRELGILLCNRSLINTLQHQFKQDAKANID